MKRWTPLLTVLLTLALAGAALACPNCKDSIAMNGDGSSSGGLPAGFNYSIYFMLAGLFAVLGFVGFTIVKAVRASDADSARRGFPL
jgi:hypothetical protein